MVGNFVPTLLPCISFSNSWPTPAAPLLGLLPWLLLDCPAPDSNWLPAATEVVKFELLSFSMLDERLSLPALPVYLIVHGGAWAVRSIVRVTRSAWPSAEVGDMAGRPMIPPGPDLGTMGGKSVQECRSIFSSSSSGLVPAEEMEEEDRERSLDVDPRECDDLTDPARWSFRFLVFFFASLPNEFSASSAPSFAARVLFSPVAAASFPDLSRGGWWESLPASRRDAVPENTCVPQEISFLACKGLL